MFKDKILRRESGILLYGITPPKAHTPVEKIKEIAFKTKARIQPLNIDGLVLYDIQDESSRVKDERPFPYFPTLAPDFFASEYLHDLFVSKIIYRSVGKFTPNELGRWINTIEGQSHSVVFVGAPSKQQTVHLKLPEAYQVWKETNPSIILGGVTIPERHHGERSEHLRILGKVDHGCSFFISQCVYNIEFVKNVVSDLYYHSQKNSTPFPTIIFTLTSCGSLKTLDFMNWLGINVPMWLRNDLHHSQDILSKSVDLSIDIAEEITEYCIGKGIPFGFNIESVSIRKEEIEASEFLLERVDLILQRNKLRTAAETKLRQVLAE